MTATLAAKITSVKTRGVRVSGDPEHEAPFHARLGDELVEVVAYYQASGLATLRRGAFGTTPAAHAAAVEFVVAGWADGMAGTGAGRYALFGSGAPVDGADGTGALVAGAASTYTDAVTGAVYVNTGTAAEPVWLSSGGGALTGDLHMGGHSLEGANHGDEDERLGGYITINDADEDGGGPIFIYGGGDVVAGNGAILGVKAASNDDNKAGGVDLTTGEGGDNDALGGDFKVTLGAGDGTGRNGQFILVGLPTVDPEVVGALWSDEGVVTVSAG